MSETEVKALQPNEEPSDLVARLDKEIAEDMERAYGKPQEVKNENLPEEPSEVEQLEPEVGEAEESGEVEAEVAEETQETEAEAKPEEGQKEQEEPKKKKRVSWKSEAEEWKKRYTTFKPKADATIFSLRQEVAAKSEELGRYAEALNITRKQLEEAHNNVATDKADVADVLTDAEKDYLGDDGIASMKKMAAAMVEQKLGPLQAKVNQYEENDVYNKQSAAKSANALAHSSFMHRLAKQVPNMQEIVEHPEFSKWGNELDPISGRTIRQEFQAAEGRMDVRVVSSYLKEFEALINPQSKLAEHVAPIGTGGGTKVQSVATEQAQKNAANAPLSLAKIEDFYDGVAKGRYKGRENEVREMEAYIDEAIRTNNIVA